MHLRSWSTTVYIDFMIRSSFTFFLILLFASCSNRSTNDVFWKSDFADGMNEHHWGIQESKMWGMENLSIKTIEDRQVLNVVYPKGSASPNVTVNEGAPVGGGQFLAALCNVDSVFFKYNVRFSPDFDFVKGGKLPGLYGGTANSGGSIPTGYDGFSTRYMWREDGVGELYLYTPESEQWGTPIGAGNWTFEAGKWHSVQHQVVLNTPNVHDGKVNIWIDGELVHSEEGLLFRSTEDLKINGIFFSTFFGGNDGSWGSGLDTYIDFDDFSLSQTYIK
ncbi:hypothetical protein RCC89_11890 [Cytophagaceae bacterium ABcell3]|nr:hypothetical protein RCC89_11890 [Cytophagaceae bacterium ABcell3]